MPAAAIHNLAVRAANRGDVPAILAIVNHYISASTATMMVEPQTLTEREAWLAQHAPPYAVVVAQFETRIVGWAALSMHNPRAGYRHTADVSVYVHPEFHRRGVGRALLSELIERARAAGHHALVAICCSESEASIALHESLGFERCGVLREVGRKFDRWLDVVHLQLIL